MIIVQGKVLEVGDTAVFRCGGKAVVLGYDGKDSVYFPDLDNGYYIYNDSGKLYGFESHLIDIIDIIKAPKPEIVEVTSEVSFSSGIYDKKTEHTIAMKYRESFKYLKEPIEFKLKYVLDVTSRKILSVEVV